MNGRLQIKSKDLLFVAAWEEDKAPKTCAAIRKLLPIRDKLVQTRWSGEAAWISIDHLDLNIEFENHTSIRPEARFSLTRDSLAAKRSSSPMALPPSQAKWVLWPGITSPPSLPVRNSWKSWVEGYL